MSFLYDPPLLAATGYAIGRRATDPRAERGAEAATLATFLVVSVALYRNDEWTRPMWRLFRARDGRDWMLNSGITNHDETRPTEATHRVAAAIFTLYPLVLRWGVHRGRRARGAGAGRSRRLPRSGRRRGS